MIRATIILTLVCLPATAHAQIATSDFARGAAIRGDGASMLRVAVSDDVYKTTTRSDLGDLRVLNAAGAAVPHTLRETPGPASEEAEWRAVPSFPMTDVQAGNVAKTQVRVDASGAVLEVTHGAAGHLTSAYLVDASGIDTPIRRIALSWQAAATVTFLARVSIQGSDDLDRWRPVVLSAALAQLQRDGHTLTQNEIELPVAERARYLRISWPKDLVGVTLTSVRVLPRTTERMPETHWMTLNAERVDRDGSAQYDTRGMFPVQYIDLEFADAADVASLTIRSRETSSAEWAFRQIGLFYSLRESNAAVHNRIVGVTRTTDRYWRLEPGRDTGWTPAAAPHLKVGWQPHEIVFVAQGPAPYMLVYGSAHVGPADAPVDALLASLRESELANRVHQATLDDAHTLGGAAALVAAPSYRRFVLWGILVLAVGALAWLAVRTLRETRDTRDGP